MKPLLFAFVFGLFSSVICGEFAYFEGRSGQILLNEKQSGNDELKLALWNGNVKFSQDQPSFSEANFVDYLSFSLGAPLSENQAAAFSRADMFQLSRANVLFVLDSAVHPDELAWPLLEQMQQISIVKSFYPQDSVATLTSWATGHSPSEHGIVSQAWKLPDGVQSAYKASALPEIQNFADLVARTFPKSFTLSASSDFQMTSALAVSQEFAAQQSSTNHFGLFWDGKCFASIHPNTKSPLSLCQEDILKQLTQDDFFGLSVRKNDDTITINSVPFKFTSKGDLSFFAEIFLALAVPAHMQSLHTAAQDVSPDLFSFTFSSLKDIEQRYGVDSPQVQLARVIVGKTVSKVLSDFSGLYETQLTGQVLFLQNAKPSEENKRRVYALVKNQVQDKESFQQFYPMIYLNNILQTDQVCQTLRNELSSTMEIYCAQATYQFPIRDSQQVVGNGTDPTKDQVKTFQIVLWIAIALIFTTFAIVYTISTMDVGGDSLVFRLSNLNTKKNL